MDQLNLFEELGKFNPHLREHESNDWKWSFKDYPPQENIKVFSCFACGGGSTMGYKLCGCQVLGDLEIDKKVNDIYVKNHNPRFNFVMDIRDFNKLEDLPEELYSLDILDGSPPCTTFSMAGKREETWGKKKKFREGQAEQTLDDLSFHFIDTAKKLKPKVVIMENVEGLLLGAAWSYVQKIYSQFDEAGYLVNHYLLKGESLGVPQKRHRVFFIAVRKDLNFNFDNLDINFNYKIVNYSMVKEGKGREITSPTAKRLTENARPFDVSFADVCKRLGEKENGFGRAFLWDDSIAPTIVSANDYIRGFEKVYASAEDIRNIQTFPQDYDFCGMSPNYLCGMSVPPIMIKRLVTRIKDTGIFKEA
jgi:DNA (cytosine-5)-methyltransferase 1